jgi:hypothetical protein
MKTKSLLLALLVLPIFMHAQSIAWMNAYHTGTIIDMDAHPEGRTVTAINDAQDVVYDVVDEQPELGETFTTAASWLFSKDANGAMEWTIPFYIQPSAFSLWDVELANDGSVYVSGSTNGQADFDPGAEVYTLSEAPAGFLAKYSATGDFIWAIPVGDFDVYSNNYICVDDLGNIVMSGFFMGSFDFDPGVGQVSLTANATHSNTYVCKYNPSGDLIWAKVLTSGSHVLPSAIAVNGNGSVLVAGTYSTIQMGQAPLDLDPGTGQYLVEGNDLTPGQTAFFTLLNANGDFIEGYGVEDLSIVVPNSITATSDNGFAVLGEYTRDFDADFGTNVNTLASIGPMNFSDIFILKMTESFDLQWVKSMGNSTGNHGGHCIRVSAEGELMASGFSGGGNIDINPGSGVFTIEGGSSSTETAFLLRMADDGSFLWGEQVSDSALCTIKSIDFLGNGDLMIAINAAEQVTCSPHLNYTQPMLDPSVFYFYIFMIGKVQQGVPTSIEPMNHGSVELYPQPAVDQLNIMGNIKAGQAYRIINISGKTIEAGTVNGSVISIDDLALGYYYLLLENQPTALPFLKSEN